MEGFSMEALNRIIFGTLIGNTSGFKSFIIIKKNIYDWILVVLVLHFSLRIKHSNIQKKKRQFTCLPV